MDRRVPRVAAVVRGKRNAMILARKAPNPEATSSGSNRQRPSIKNSNKRAGTDFIDTVVDQVPAVLCRNLAIIGRFCDGRRVSRHS